MNSPHKRGNDAPSVSGGPSTAKITPSKASEFPPLRSRSPKKDARSTASTTKRRRDDANKTTGLPRVGSKVSYEKDGDHLPQVLESGEELEVLKCILVREGYLQRLAHASAQGKVSGSQLSETIDVLDLLRVATIDVVETIVNWRIKQQRHAQSTQSEAPVFTWNSLNYLLKLASDLNFLEKHQGLIQWLGFTLVRNPFILPLNLNTRSQLDHVANDALYASPGRIRRDDSSSQFVQVGGKRAPIDPGQDAMSALRTAKAAALAERKRAKNPYETRILNDEELVPIARTGARTSSAASDRPGSRATALGIVEIPSQIGEIDMTRIHACEKVILQEEAQHGRYTRDAQGHLVPESEAIRRRNMSELSGDAYARTRDESASNGVASFDPSEPNSYVDNHSGRHDSGSLLPPHAHAKKRAGMLGPISNPQQRKPSRKPPADRSRGAHLEEMLRQERRATLDLGILIDRVREEIERKEMDLAYFESFPGVQMFGTELEDFRCKTYAEVALLRRDIAEKEYIYRSRTANLNRKEEIIHTFKENRKSVVEVERSTRLQNPKASIGSSAGGSTNQDPQPPQTDSGTTGQAVEAPSDEPRAGRHLSVSPTPSQQAFTRPIVHDMCATFIQKIARGKLARAAFGVLKIEYYVGSKYIQAVVRGFLARRRVAKMYWQLTASLILQRFARGMLARRLVARKRHTRAMQHAALRIQRTARGHFGRMRMKRVRRLFTGRKHLLCSMDELNLSDLKELAGACQKMAATPSLKGHTKTQADHHRPLPSLVLGLVRVVMVFTTDSDDDVNVTSVRWKEAAHFLRCSSRLQRRVGKVAGIAAMGDRYLRPSPLGMALLDMYCKDQDFQERTFANLGNGWRAAMVLYRWIKAYYAVCQEQGVVESKSAPRSMRPFLFAESTDVVEAMQERAEEEENTIQELALERRFVPRELVCSMKHRARAVLLVVAFDVPQAARSSVIDQLCAALPGLFVVMNRRAQVGNTDAMDTDRQQEQRIAKAHKQQVEILGADYSSIRESLAVGHSVILDCDVGLTDAQQRQFIGAFTALKASIKPSPMCLLLRGSLRNRPGLDDIDWAASSPRARKQDFNSASQRAMFDADIKREFEQSANWLYRVNQPESASEMVHMSALESSTSAVALAFVLVMEAVVILLTPSKRYEGPQPHASGVSWKLARRLLASPLFFVSKLATTKYDCISRDNLRALGAYLSHNHWPSATLAHGVGSGGGLLHALASWVRSVVTCAQMALDRHGLAPSISRSAPVAGLFDSVVMYHNFLSNDGDIVASQELLDAALADVRVYRKVHALDGRRCVISVYHDCQRFFFSAYDPMTSWRWQRVVPEEEIDMLLAPNSVERGEDAFVHRQPPSSQEEMYDRLVRLCLLQPMTSLTAAADAKGRRSGSGKTTAVDAGMSPATQQLVVRPPSVRLFRRVLQLGGHRVTVTLAELSRGRIQVDVTIHGLSLALRRVLSLEQILERLSHQQSRNVFIPPERLPLLVLERLHLYRRKPSSPSISPASRADKPDPQATSTLQLGVRTKEAAPGRVVLRKAIRSRWLSPAGTHHPQVYLLTVVEHHSTGQFRAEMYQPLSSETFSRLLSKREFQDLCLPELCQHPASVASGSLLRIVMKLLRFEKDPDEADESQASIIACTLRHHMLVRFPLAIRFVVSPHHAVEKRGVVRTYVQVETKQLAEREGVRFRICFPETCEEQALEWEDEQVDSFFATSTASWATALRTERKRLAYELARHALRWDPDNQRVVAELPCGSFVASLCTRDTGVRKPTSRAMVPARSKKSLFSACSSRSLLAVSTSCVRLLDSEDDEEELSESDKQRCRRVLFVYDRDELVHSGSYRANGVLVTVQVFMKAVIVTTPKPRLPVDRLEQADSFEIAFDFYHPATSTSQRCAIHGRTHLREVVGPDKAALIASATVHELLEHIVEARSSVHFENVETKTHAQSQRMVVSFVRDRLYAKHKVTPLPKTLQADAAANATKLIDAKPDRGLKLLTKTKTLADDSGGKVILTVFDVRHTRAAPQATAGDRDARSHVQLRVDGYICDSSTRLSLSLEAADLVHIVDEQLAVRLEPSSEPRMRDSEEMTRHKQRLAQLVIDHIGVERKRDGTPDRLFIVEMSTTSLNPRTVKQEMKSRRLVGKTVRLIRQAPVVITVDAIGDIECEGFEIQCYEPQTSARASLIVQPAAIGLSAQDVDSVTALDSLDRRTAASLVAHILAHVHIDAASKDDAQGKVWALTMNVHDDDGEHDQRHGLLQRLEEGSTSPNEGFHVGKVWRGLVAAATAGQELCVVHVGLETAHDDVEIARARVLCSVLALRKRLVTTRVLTSDAMSALLSRRHVQPDEWLRECASRLRIRLVPPAPQGKHEDTSDTHVHREESSAWRLVVEMQE